MPDISSQGSSSLGTPRSSASVSTESSRRGSLKPSRLPERDAEPLTPSSPPVRLTRKRAATLSTERANLPHIIGDLAINSTSTTGPPTSDITREQVCLCQPDPKIPRPRNAFILYRQHYQAQVIAQNPGLANPEISKIIGEQWREQAPEVKGDWKRLAEEEKQRHRRQYPGYRYQPRRGGKPTGIRPVSASAFSDDPGRCPKCSGRYISTPSTPSTPFARSFGAASSSHSEHLPPPLTPTAISRNPAIQQSSSLAQMQTSRIDSPLASPFRQHSPRHAPHPHLQQLQTHREKDEDMDLLLSPSADHKRRRFNADLQLKHGYPSPSQRSPRSGLPMATTTYRPQQPLPYAPPGNIGLAPQQSSVVQQPRNPYLNRPGTFDQSLRLPPLQTQLPGPNQSSANRIDMRAESRESHARSVEAMVMTIPYINKIKVLGKISPPLQPASAGSPVQQVRGAVIAIEGADRALLYEVGAFINEYLSRDSSCAVKTWTISSPSQAASPQSSDTEMASQERTSDAGSSSSTSEPTSGDSFVEYLSIISSWHKKSLEMTKYITTPPADSPTSSSPRTTIPIALLPHGFSLTASDAFALRIPINDSYAPVDHWQWMATLWRGIVGPDLTVYVKRVEREELERHGGGVEIRPDCAAIVVRVLGATGALEEKTARRLGFEVLEFVRGLETGIGRGAG